MINLSIAFDNNNEDAGDYFALSKEDLMSFLEIYSGNFSVNLLDSSNCNEKNIEAEINLINSGNFLFITYCHGNEDRLEANNCSFVESDKNVNLFINSLFYSVSCLSGKKLGQNLIDNGCHIFIGYKEVFRIIPSNYQITIECSNFAFKKFVEGMPIGDAFDLMIEFYYQEVDKLYDSPGDELKAFFFKSECRITYSIRKP